jgi:hypothetical protein
MKNSILSLTMLSMMLFLSSCEAIAGIFKAGMSVGAFAVIVIVVILIGLLFRMVSGTK